MRRNRMRSYTIDAENEEGYIAEYDRMQKSRLSKIAFVQKILENEEEDSSSFNKHKNEEDDDGDEYCGLGAAKYEVDEDDEDNLGLGKDNYDENSSYLFFKILFA